VKVRGHRIELGEIEAVLSADPRLKEVAVVVEGGGMQAKLVAYAVAHGEPPSLIALKRVCAARLPRYMIIDAVHYLPVLPRTGNGKVNRAALAPAKQPEERIR
jgi:acyl-coenzyme A synthetase/AMP-(fatty) acid ligase